MTTAHPANRVDHRRTAAPRRPVVEAAAPQGRIAPQAQCAPRLEIKRNARTVSHIIRRIGTPPSARGSATGANCPDIFELSDGRFAVIGTDLTEELDGKLPADASRADYERIVVVSRRTLIDAKGDIPDA